jgi:hypothetical protein
MLFYGAHFSLDYQHKKYKKRVIIIKSFLGTKQGHPLRGILFALAHY